MKAKSRITDFGLVEGVYFRVKYEGSRWYKVKLGKGFWSTIARVHFEEPTAEYYERGV